MSDSELCWMSAVDIAGAVRAKEVSPVEVLDAFLERIEQVNPKINAIVTLLAEEAREQAKRAEEDMAGGGEIGPLHGVPVGIKEDTDVKGVVSTHGSLLLEDNVAEMDAVLVERLRAAGAIVLGKTNMPELGLVGITDNLVFGHTRNPWDTTKTSGGSSGGSAAAVAAGIIPLAQGSDGGGSIRIPSSLCGVVGLKPQFGRIPRYPRMYGWETLDHEGPLTRDVRDAALMLDVMKGPHEGDRYSLPAQDTSCFDSLDTNVEGLKVAYSKDLGYAVVDGEVAELVEKAVAHLAELGCHVTEVDLDLMDMGMDLIFTEICETVTAHGEELTDQKDKVYPLYQPFLEMAPNITGSQIVDVQYHRQDLWEDLWPVFEEYDVLVTPTTACPAFDIEERGPLGPGKVAGVEVTPATWISFTYPFNFTGQPALTVPCGFASGGLPVGMQLVGRRFDESTILNLAAAYQDAHPWSKERPSP